LRALGADGAITERRTFGGTAHNPDMLRRTHPKILPIRKGADLIRVPNRLCLFPEHDDLLLETDDIGCSMREGHSPGEL
jgi:hypothetical protein